MTKTLSRPLLTLTALSCLTACDPAFAVPVEVNVSEQFQAEWDKGYPAEVGIRFESDIALPNDTRGFQLGSFCGATSEPVKFVTRLDTLGCVPKGLKVRVWIAPASGAAQNPCSTASSPVVKQEDLFSAPNAETTPEQGVVKLVELKAKSCELSETAILDF